MSFLPKTFFSVIIPTYNRQSQLLRALYSVLEQDFKDLEIWVIDDGSTDETQRLLAPLIKEHPQLNYVFQPQQGVSAARNLGIFKAQSPWLAFLDSDDIWHPTKLSKAYLALESEKPLIFHSHENWVKNNKTIPQKLVRPEGWVYQDCVKQCCIGPSTSVVHKKVFHKIGNFRADFPVCEDYDFWLRSSQIYQVKCLPEDLVTKYGGHNDQLSLSFHSLDLWRSISLYSQLASPYLDSENKNFTAEQLHLRCQYLLKGFEKYENYEHKAFIEHLRSQALRWLNS